MKPIFSWTTPTLSGLNSQRHISFTKNKQSFPGKIKTATSIKLKFAMVVCYPIIIVLISSFIATLPSTVFWGLIIDKACVMWNTVCVERSRGACELYDADKLRLMIHLTYGLIRYAVFNLFIAMMFSK